MEHFLRLAEPIVLQALLGLLALAVLAVLPKLVHLAFVVAGNLINRIRIAQVQAVVKVLVMAAQQSIKDNGDKFNYVSNILCARFPWLPAESVKALIEAAVLQLKTELAALAPAPCAPAAPPEVKP